MSNGVTMRELLFYESAEASFELKLAKLREFHSAVTAPGTVIRAMHGSECQYHGRVGKAHAACSCGRAERQARIDKALAALAECDEDDTAEAVK